MYLKRIWENKQILWYKTRITLYGRRWQHIICLFQRGYFSSRTTKKSFFLVLENLLQAFSSCQRLIWSRGSWCGWRFKSGCRRISRYVLTAANRNYILSKIRKCQNIQNAIERSKDDWHKHLFIWEFLLQIKSAFHVPIKNNIINFELIFFQADNKSYNPFKKPRKISPNIAIHNKSFDTSYMMRTTYKIFINW